MVVSRWRQAFCFENVAHLVVMSGGWRPMRGDSSHAGAVAGEVPQAMLEPLTSPHLPHLPLSPYLPSSALVSPYAMPLPVRIGVGVHCAKPPCDKYQDGSFMPLE